MAEFKLKRGHNIRIAGDAEKIVESLPTPRRVAVQPFEFPGIKPRLAVEEGDAVKRGSVVFTSKQHPEMKFLSPVSGKVVEIVRGERRRLMEIVIDNDEKDDAEDFGGWSAEQIEKAGRDDVTELLLKSGLWPLIRQRPFSVTANPENQPRDIFISGMDTAPLAADPNLMLEGLDEEFQLGLNALKKLTDGKIHLSLSGNGEKIASAFTNAGGVEKHTFSGIHPAGNVGVHIHHINPIKLNEIVWVIKPYGVALIGMLLKTGRFPVERIIAKAGSSLKNRKYYKTMYGAPNSMAIPEGDLVDDEVRYIVGDVLSGRKASAATYVSYDVPLITVIPEGKKERTLFKYISPGLNLPSFSKTFLSSWLTSPDTKFEIDTLRKGGVRAFVQTGDYEKVVPMDILPMALIKTIMAEDIEEMEALGILELDEEDLALCSYICLSKINFGEILRQGLDMIQKEG